MRARAMLCVGLWVAGWGCTGAEPDAADPGDDGDTTPTVDAGGSRPPQVLFDAGGAPQDAAASKSDAGPTSNVGKSASRLSGFPKGFRVSSPTASARVKHNKRVDPNQAKTPQERSDQIATVLAGSTYEDCGVMLGALMGGAGDVQCYGPNLDYKNHPDALGGQPASGQLPHGDLGLWTATEGPSQACAAAKLNSLIEGLGRKVDFGLYAAASMVCTGRVSGKLGIGEHDAGAPAEAGVGDGGGLSVGDGGELALPAEALIEGLEKLTLTTELAMVLAINPGLTVKLATLERLPDEGSQHVYHYVLELTVPNQPDARTVHTEMLHKSNPQTPGDYWGRIWGLASGAQTEAYSVTYKRSEGDGRLRSHALAASYNMPQSLAQVFDAQGVLKLQSDWSGGMTQAIFDLDAATSTVGDVSFAWQAGRGDSHARVFNVHTELAGQTLSGCGFFGYGPGFAATQASYPNNSISTFICNWAGPGNNHSGLVGFAQKQCMSQDLAGVFLPTENAISYAPVNSCSSAGTSFEYKLMSETSYASAPIANALVKLATDADFAKYEPPQPL